MVAPAEKILAWENKFHEFITQVVTGADCVSNPFPVLNEGENLVSLKLTGEQLRQVVSSIQVGAEWAYPDISQQILFNFWQAFACPPLLSEQDCVEYPTYSSFLRYTPVNPFISPDEIPEGYITQPFLVNGENGNDIPNYEHYDVLIPLAAITLDANWFDTIAGQLPTIEVLVNGSGKVGLKMLTSPQGGVAVVTLDNPPNILDIIAGVITGSDNIIDLNQDLVSLPPETATELIYELEIPTTGVHTVYVVFLPIIDDSLIPIRFGGGFRGVVLCDFIPEGTMGIQNLRFLNCNLEAQDAQGAWSIVEGWEDWLDCVPTGGGDGVAAVDFDIHRNSFSPDQTFTNTAFNDFAAGIANFNITAKGTKALVICDNISATNSVAAGETEFQVTLGGNVGIDSHGITSMVGTAAKELQVSQYWEGLTIGNSYTIQLQKRVTSGTGTMQAESKLNWTIIWVSDFSQLFVEDIRFNAGTRELEKKIGGVWLTVTDSLATVLNSIQTIANNAAATAAAAQNTANNAQTVANGAVTVNNTQNGRLDDLEADVNSIVTVDIPQINLNLADHETRIDALEAAVDALEADAAENWIKDFDFMTGLGAQGWTGAVFNAPSGPTDPNGGFSIGGTVNLFHNATTIEDSRVLWMRLTIFGGGSAPPEDIDAAFGGSSQQSINLFLNTLTTHWIKVENQDGAYIASIAILGAESNGRLQKIRFIGKGNNPFV